MLGRSFRRRARARRRGLLQSDAGVARADGLGCWALGAHLVGQAVCDQIDERHRAILPAEVWGDGDPAGVRRRAADRMRDTARAAARLGVTQVNGFTGSPVWHLICSFPPNDFDEIERGYERFAETWSSILDVFEAEGVRFGLEVHPTEIAYDFVTTGKALEALDNRASFGVNLDPSHFAHQFLDPAQFALEFAPRIYHVHVKDSKRRLDGRRSILGSHLNFGDEARGWDFVSPGHGDVDFEELFPRAQPHRVRRPAFDRVGGLGDGPRIRGPGRPRLRPPDGLRALGDRVRCRDAARSLISVRCTAKSTDSGSGLRYRRHIGSIVPSVDEGARQRLTARFGGEIETWFDELPGVLIALAERWQFEFGSAIPRGSVSVVFRCRTADGRGAVLKASPDRARLAYEAAALDSWHTVHTPAVLALDDRLGALLLEAIEPGTPLIVSSAYPDPDSAAELLSALHESGVPDPSCPTVEQRVAYLFDASAKLYERHPELAALIPPALYERGRRLATRLARDTSPVVLLHGDLTPSNILDGGAERGLVAIDPAPCLGDAAFDAVDLILWQADDLGTIEERSERLSAATGVDAERLLGWCAAFAGMTALELASLGNGTGPRNEALLELAAQR